MAFSPIPETIDAAARCLALGDQNGAERIALTLLAIRGRDANALHVLALVRAQQERFDEAVTLLGQSLAVQPRQPQAHCNLGKALAQMGRTDEAVAAFRVALKLKSDFVEALVELGSCLKAAEMYDEAETTYRKLLRLKPGDPAALLALGEVQLTAGKLEDAEIVLSRGLQVSSDAGLKARFHANLAELRQRLGRGEEALADLEQAENLDASLRAPGHRRAELLHDMKRYDESLALYRVLLARDPLNVLLHNDYNDLLYRLDREEDYLKSFDRVPLTQPLQLAKATFLMHGMRHEESHALFTAMLAHDPGDKHAATGLATCLSRLGRYSEAAEAFEKLILHHRHDPNLYANAAAAFISHGDAVRALELCETACELAPDNQVCLALMGTALRLLGDERDEILSGYDTLIRTFDLEPPEGFSNMAAFNQELNIYLDRLHPHTREHIAQSLRGGSQTIEEVFGVGHDLIDRLQQSISEAVSRYVAELREDASHPFLSRRGRNFAYAGSWSSRLGSNGYHANHMHPGGWISSCYYVAVPEAAQNEISREGWIKFGEPDIAVGLSKPIRRTIRPIPGQLVLFPSYMWHGTIPFRSPSTRTTIAFDVVPA